MLPAIWSWLHTPWSGADTHIIAPAVSWHGRSMVLAWSVLLPLGVLCARFFKIWPGQDWPQVLDNKNWWYAHQGLQYGGVLVMLPGFWLILGQAQGATPAARWHALLGWAVALLGLLQVLSGIFRGSKGGPTDKTLRGDHYDMTAWRTAFEYWHKSAGYCALLLAVSATFLGLQVADAPRWMVLCIALWWLGMGAAFVALQKRGRAMDTWQAIWGEEKQHKVVGFGMRQYSAREWQEKFLPHGKYNRKQQTMTATTLETKPRGLHLAQVVKRFGDATVVEQLNLHIDQGEFMVLLGESGCGKSTTLRMIAGLEEVSGGHIFLDGRDITHATPRERNIAMVFQSYALYPHMSVAQNMSFALQLAGRSRQEIHARVQEAAKILHIEHLLERKPRDLSGGQRQRVAIGRAIVREPGVFLFDEPLSNLDAKLRGHMRSELALLHRRLGKTTVYVTHDQVEAMTLASRIAIFDKGRIQQIATPQEIFQHPANVFVAGFIGTPGMNFFPAKYLPEQNLLQGEGFSWPAPDWLRARTAPVPEALSLGLRPQALQACAQEEAGLSMQVDVVEYLGNESQVMGHIAGGHSVCATLAGNAHSLLQNRLHLRFEPQDLQVFDRASGQNLRQIS